ncbi:MAG: diaminobutyrate acetyltransferase [Methanomicrobiales archaeon]
MIKKINRHMDSENDENSSIIIRKPDLKDGKSVYNLVKNSQPLDLNSLYYYLLMCAHFKNTSTVAQYEEDIVGYVSAYRKPQNNNTLFIWQVAVDGKMRGQGLATRMINNILKRDELKDLEFIETTVTPSNKASTALFEKLSTRCGADLSISPFFTSELFGESGHEEELLFKIGPL